MKLSRFNRWERAEFEHFGWGIRDWEGGEVLGFTVQFRGVMPGGARSLLRVPEEGRSRDPLLGVMIHVDGDRIFGGDIKEVHDLDILNRRVEQDGERIDGTSYRLSTAFFFDPIFYSPVVGGVDVCVEPREQAREEFGFFEVVMNKLEP